MSSHKGRDLSSVLDDRSLSDRTNPSQVCMKLFCHSNRLTDPLDGVKTVPVHLHLSEGLQIPMNKTEVNVQKQAIQRLLPLLLQVQA